MTGICANSLVNIEVLAFNSAPHIQRNHHAQLVLPVKFAVIIEQRHFRQNRGASRDNGAVGRD
ncbi:hypothetical protein D3C75_1370390 [compost metagenome]